MHEFLTRLVEMDIEEKRHLALRRGRLLDDVFSDGKMLVVIEEGKLEVLSHSGALVNLLGEGEAYGVANLFADSSLPSRLKAKTDVRLTLIPKTVVRALMDQDITLYHAYCAMLNDRLDFLFSRVSLLSIKSNRGRVASYLADSRRAVFSSREELANYLAMGKSALFRELAYLEGLGAIKYSGQDIEVLDKDKLMEVLNA